MAEVKRQEEINVGMVEMVDTKDLKSFGFKLCEFKFRYPHQKQEIK